MERLGDEEAMDRIEEQIEAIIEEMRGLIEVDG